MAAVVIALAMIGAGIGIGFGVWGATSPAASVAPVTPGRQGLPVRPSFPTTGAFLGVYVGAGTTSPGSTGSTAATSPFGTGAAVKRVVSGSPATKAGIRSGDTITSFATAHVSSALTLVFDVEHAQPGEHVKVAWTTPSGHHESATVVLAKRPAAKSVG